MCESGSPCRGPSTPTNDWPVPTPNTLQDPRPLTPDAAVCHQAAVSTEAGDGEGMGEEEGCTVRGGSKWWEWSVPWPGVPKVNQVSHLPLPSCVMVEVEIKEAPGWSGLLHRPPPPNTEDRPNTAVNYNTLGPLSGRNQCQSRKLSPLIFGPLHNIYTKDGQEYYTLPIIQEAPSEVRESREAPYQAIPGVLVTSSEPGNIVDSHQQHDVPRVHMMHEYQALPTQVMCSEVEGTTSSHEYHATLALKQERSDYQPQLTIGQTLFEEKFAGDSLIVCEESWWDPQEGDLSSPTLYAHTGHTSLHLIPTQNSKGVAGSAEEGVQQQTWGHLKEEEEKGEEDDCGYHDRPVVHSLSPDQHYVSSSTCYTTTHFGGAVERASEEDALTCLHPEYTPHHHVSSADLEMEVHQYRLLLRLHQAASTITTRIHYKFPTL
ncbi:uncharacterized protein [Procambarus clarkii]|uniref:uncharacterized protein isoform X1 n=1 Tax=Procambarus clarkii TaxID=6728 RepID=UPI001E67358B|nr:uncharacterized protein LOC123756421 isoform X2 [Procambarus clarkii]